MCAGTHVWALLPHWSLLCCMLQNMGQSQETSDRLQSACLQYTWFLASYSQHCPNDFPAATQQQQPPHLFCKYQGLRGSMQGGFLLDHQGESRSVSTLPPPPNPLSAPSQPGLHPQVPLFFFFFLFSFPSLFSPFLPFLFFVCRTENITVALPPSTAEHHTI